MDDAAKARAQFLKYIRKNLDEASANHSTVTDDFLSPFLPKSDTEPSKLQLFRQLMQKPITVSDESLGHIFNIKESTRTEAVPDGGICYLVSWQLTKKDLMDLIADLNSDKAEGRQSLRARFKNWEVQMQNSADNDLVFIRYVGQTMNQTPFDRYRRGTRNAHRISIFEVFLRLLEKKPNKSHTRKVFGLPDTFTCHTYPDREQEKATRSRKVIYERTDLFECTLIALFGPTSLLNTQLGGRSLIYSPTEDDRNLFESIGTSVVSKISQLKLESMGTEIQDLKSLSKSACEWMKEKSGQDQAWIKANELQIDSFFLRDASCQLINGYCLLSIVAEAPTNVTLSKMTGFFDGTSKSAQIVIDLVSTVLDLDCKPGRCQPEELLNFTSFINTFPFPRSSSRIPDDKAKEHLGSYLCITQPLLTITLGECALQHCKKQNIRNVIQVSCEAFIQSTESEQGHVHTIVLPHPHPGYVTRSDQSTVQKRVYVLCWVVTWVYIDTTLDFISRRDRIGADRKSLCETILSKAQDRLKKTGLDTAFGEAKKKLLEQQGVQRKVDKSKKTSQETGQESIEHQPSEAVVKIRKRKYVPDKSWDDMFSANKSYILAEKAFLDTLQELDRVPADPELRQKEAQDLWAHKLRSKHLGSSSSAKAEWLAFFNSQPESYYVLACVMAFAKTELLGSNMVNLMMSGLSETKILPLHQWTSQQRCDRLQNIGKAMMDRQIAFSKAKNPDVGLLTSENLPQTDLGKTSYVTFDFWGSGGLIQKIKLRSDTLFSKPTYLDKRFLRFHRDGVDVVDELEQRVNCAFSDNLASIPKAKLDTFGENLAWLWQEMMSATEEA